MSVTDGLRDCGEAEIVFAEGGPDREPDPGEARLSISALGIDYAEKPFDNGYAPKSAYPSRIEYDVVGEVEAVGDGVEKVHVGQRVVGIPPSRLGGRGVYADLAVFPAQALLPWPEALDVKQAAGLWTPWLTAWGALVRLGGLRRDDVVLVTAPYRSIGIAALQTVAATGATAIAVIRGPVNQDELLDAGADYVVATAIDNLRERVLDITDGRGATLAFDGLGGPQLESVAESMGQGGRIVLGGHLNDSWTYIPIVPMMTKSLTLRAHSIQHTTSNPDIFAAAVKDILRGVEQGKYRPIVDRTFPLSEIVEAQARLDAFDCLGKTVVLPGAVRAKG